MKVVVKMVTAMLAGLIVYAVSFLLLKYTGGWIGEGDITLFQNLASLNGLAAGGITFVLFDKYVYIKD